MAVDADDVLVGGQVEPEGRNVAAGRRNFVNYDVHVMHRVQRHVGECSIDGSELAASTHTCLILPVTGSATPFTGWAVWPPENSRTANIMAPAGKPRHLMIRIACEQLPPYRRVDCGKPILEGITLSIGRLVQPVALIDRACPSS